MPRGENNIPFTVSQRLQAFWSKVLQCENGCWEFNGSRNSEGYGNFWDKGQCKKAHRFAWECFFGEIPNNLLVRHKCDNPACCNPDHLELGTNKDNSRDKFERNRAASMRGASNSSAYLTEEHTLKIYSYLRYTDMRDKDIAEIFKISTGHLSNIKRGYCWNHLWRAVTDATYTD